MLKSTIHYSLIALSPSELWEAAGKISPALPPMLQENDVWVGEEQGQGEHMI